MIAGWRSRLGIALGLLRHEPRGDGVGQRPVAIPFATLNFMRTNDVIWGINFKRFIRS